MFSWLQKFEDPMNPLLGPNIKMLNLFGVWQPPGTKLRNTLYNAFYFSTISFVLAQFTDLYFQLNNFNKALNNLSLTSISVICSTKWLTYILHQSQWQKLVAAISEEELSQLKKQDPKVIKKMAEYKLYARVVSYMYWLLVLLTNVTLIMTPLLKLYISTTLRENIKNGLEEYPQIISCWFPFDCNSMPGYVYSCVIEILMAIQGSGVIAGHDANAITIMTFIKGQMQILKEKCVLIFDTKENEGRSEFLSRVKECHRHHNFLLQQSKLFNSLLSPVMFVYILICSMALCCSVVQFFSKEATADQKLWAVEYTAAQIAQLFLFCWHGNEVYVESKDVDIGVFSSDWWKADVHLRRHILLLAGKLNRPILYSAGPFSDLTVPTFIGIMKGSYSFFTLFSQMQEEP
uniref:Odorant receptor n=1 Tax=Glyphodes pyloalis TaxID=1242752 RepID=A0A6M3GRX2_GLYPY|nr:olfactory receptor [Glyphodes pyloalis]